MKAVLVPPHSADFAAFAALDPRTPAARQAEAGRLYDRYGRRAHWLLLERGRPIGRLTAAVSPALRGDDGRVVGCLGDLVLPDDEAGLAALLGPAFHWLRSEGATRARAPITYHTWYPFRFVTEGFDARPPFPGEPWNPSYQPARFAAAGFEESARYVSGATEDLPSTVAANRPELDAFEGGGLAVRPFDPRRFEAELPRLHALVSTAFPGNFSFQPIDLAEFRFVHEPAYRHLDPRLFLLCEDRSLPPGAPDGLAGFLLSFPDPTAPDTVVLKTIAVHPRFRGRGVGPVLIARAHEAAIALGYRRAVHALMREGRRPATVSARAVPVFRRYAVMERPL